MTIREWTVMILKAAFGGSEDPPESIVARAELHVRALWEAAYEEGGDDREKQDPE